MNNNKFWFFALYFLYAEHPTSTIFSVLDMQCNEAK